MAKTRKKPETTVELTEENDIVKALEKRAKIYLRGIGVEDKDIAKWLKDPKRCRLYIVREKKKYHFRLSCFDRDFNRRMHDTYGIGCREPWGETMWTKNVSRLAVSTNHKATSRHVRPVRHG